MNLAQFLEHWAIIENPFRGEEARTDAIFARMGIAGRSTPDEGGPGRVRLVRPSTPSIHSEFDKILGELDRPSTSIVFGEKGSGKTAIRLQIADRIARHNEEFPDRRVLLIPYDDLNTHLDHYARVTGGDKKKDDPFAGVRLVDHLDAIVSIGTGRIVNALLTGSDKPAPAQIEDAGKRARRMPLAARRELLLLQAVYDTTDTTGARTAALKRILRLGGTGPQALMATGLWIGWIPAAAMFIWGQFFSGFGETTRTGLLIGAGVLLAMWLFLLLKVTLIDRMVGPACGPAGCTATPDGAADIERAGGEPGQARPHAGAVGCPAQQPVRGGPVCPSGAAPAGGPRAWLPHAAGADGPGR
jgi:hypothetical protein